MSCPCHRTYTTRMRRNQRKAIFATWFLAATHTTIIVDYSERSNRQDSQGGRRAHPIVKHVRGQVLQVTIEIGIEDLIPPSGFGIPKNTLEMSVRWAFAACLFAAAHTHSSVMIAI